MGRRSYVNLRLAASRFARPTSQNDGAVTRTIAVNRKKLATDEEIEQLLHLLEEADGVELKLTVPDSDQRSAVMALDVDVLKAELRQVVFFDTPDLRLSRAGVVVRARRARKGGDAVIKLRPIQPDHLSGRLRRSSAFKVELDVMPGAFVCSGSLKGEVDNTDVKEVMLGKRPIRKLFSPEQRFLYVEYAPKDIDLDSLTVCGPINVVKSKFVLDGYSAAAELWFYPDGSRILELSMKCAPAEAVHVAAEARAFLSSRGINPTGEQQTKTRKALQYFSRLNANSQRSGASP
jgi:hypothetical protein